MEMNYLSQWRLRRLRTAEPFYKLSCFPLEGAEDCFSAAYQGKATILIFRLENNPDHKGNLESPRVRSRQKSPYPSSCCRDCNQSTERCTSFSKVLLAKGLSLIPFPLLCPITQVAAQVLPEIRPWALLLNTNLFSLVLFFIKMFSFWDELRIRAETEDNRNGNGERLRSALSGEEVGAGRKVAAVEASWPLLSGPLGEGGPRRSGSLDGVWVSENIWGSSAAIEAEWLKARP